ncbi:MAG: dienelactone hydrolase family protein [Polyangiales bacterium]
MKTPLGALALTALLSTFGCATSRAGADDAHTAAMAREHANDSARANASAQEPRQPVTAEDVAYGELDGAPLRGYLARPAASSGPLPALVVIHEWWGLNDNVRMMTRRLAGEGYLALAVDLYGGQSASTPEAARALMQSATAAPERGVANLRAAATFLRDGRHAPRMGVVGWCFGGGWSLQAALALPAQVDAAVMYYGRVEADPARLAALDAPLLGLFGGADTGIPVEGVRQMESALRGLGRDVTIQVYEGAGHAFANPSGERYQPAAADDAWRRTVDFFARHLRPAGV